MQTDPIADYLTRLRNALASQHDQVTVPASGLKEEISRILKEQGYIADYSVEDARVGREIRINLRYTDDREPVISGMERVSRPGRRRYVEATGIPKILGGMGTTILSTSSGVMTGHEARQKGVGGEVVASVW